MLRWHGRRRSARSAFGLRVLAIVPTRSAGLPPVQLVVAQLAERLDCDCRVLPIGPARTAEAPQPLGRALVAVDQVVEVERVDLAGVELDESLTHVILKLSKLDLVVLADQLPRGPPTLALVSMSRIRPPLAITSNLLDGPTRRQDARRAAHASPLRCASRCSAAVLRTGADPGTSSESAPSGMMSASVLVELSYDAGVRALDLQERAVEQLRARTGILLAAPVISSFLAEARPRAAA